jgi:hypothetical protein
MSLEETSKLLAESRKVIEDSSNNVDNAPMLFNMVLRMVTSIDMCAYAYIFFIKLIYRLLSMHRFLTSSNKSLIA